MHIKITIAFFFFTLQIAKGSANDNEFISHRIVSPFQADSTTIRVLLPDIILPGETYKVLYILPVVENDKRQYGDGLKEVMQYDYHNKYKLICVAPEFTSKPWYCDHASDMGRQDESHLLKTVIPFIDDLYPTVRSGEGRLLLGFSKSGWGAFTLLLRNPEMFHKAAGWDSGIRVDTGPISEEERVEMINTIFGSAANFKKYRITALLKERGEMLGDQTRLFYYNTEGNRGPGGAEIHKLMVQLGIPHLYLFEPYRKHSWDSGWIPKAVRFLVDD